MAKRRKKVWDGIGLFDLDAGLLLAVRGADPYQAKEIRAIAQREGGTIAPVTITLSQPKKARKP